VSLTRADVAEILKLLEESSFDTLSLQSGDLKIDLRRSGAAPRRAAPPAPQSPETQLPEPAARTAPAAPQKPEEPKKPEEPGVAGVPSPMLGTFYRAPKPGEPPFVEPGKRVEPDTIIGIIEVMKLMNTVRAGVSGEVVEVLAKNATLVEYGETLIRVRTD